MTSTLVYQGNLRTKATHLKSGETAISDAPTDNNGKGEAFSPTDYVATALASCMLTIIGIVANRYEWNIDSATAEVKKVMASDPRRIEAVEVQIQLPAHLSPKARIVLERAGRNCPVAKSLHPQLEQRISFQYKD